MYEKSAQYYDRLMHFYDWEKPHRNLVKSIRMHLPDARTFLECGCGTGRYLELFARDFHTTGFDINDTMVQICSERCPGSKVFRADMTDFQIGRRFDVVACLFRSIGHVRTLERMRASVACMSRHVEPEGLLLMEPYFTPDQFWTDRVTLNTAEDEQGKIAWMYVPKREDRLSVTTSHYLVGTPEGVDHFTEEQVLGLFTTEEYESAIYDAGLEILARPPKPATGVYLCRKR